MKLYKQNTCLHDKIKPAFKVFQRAKGLLGEKDPSAAAIWIKPCNSVHTFFMAFPIDVVFVSKSLKVLKTYESLKPYRLTNPFLKAHSVFEFAEGFIEKNKIQIGDSLHVDS